MEDPAPELFMYGSSSQNSRSEKDRSAQIVRRLFGVSSVRLRTSRTTTASSSTTTAAATAAAASADDDDDDDDDAADAVL